MVWKDPMLADLSPEERNVIKWAALMHDIAKASTPTIQGKDHVHPFKSGAITLRLFQKLGMIPNLTTDKKVHLVQVIRLVEESVQPLP